MSDYVYIIEYVIIVGCDEEVRQEMYLSSQKGDFVKRYFDLKDKWYVMRVSTFRAKTEKLELEKLLGGL